MKTAEDSSVEICHGCKKPIGKSSTVVRPRVIWHCECHPDEQCKPDIVGALAKFAAIYSQIPEPLFWPMREVFQSIMKTAVAGERRAANPRDIATLELAADVLDKAGSWPLSQAIREVVKMLRGEPVDATSTEDT